jgi:hypothetical protein
LRAALISNAGFSGLSGLLLVTLPEAIATLLGPELPWLLRLLGIGLLVFAADLLHQASRSRLASWRALYASLADVLWVIGSIGLVALFPQHFNDSGVALVLAVAAAVLAMACWQLWGIHRLHRAEEAGRFRHCLASRVDAPPEAMWRVLRPLGDIARYMPDLARSEVFGEPGPGAVRACEDRAGHRWRETCIDWQEGRAFTLRFEAEAADFPFPASEMVGGWEVLPESEGSTVMVWWELKPRPAWAAVLLMPLLALKADRDFPKVVSAMADVALGRPVAAPARRRGRLLPSHC